MFGSGQPLWRIKVVYQRGGHGDLLPGFARLHIYGERKLWHSLSDGNIGFNICHAFRAVTLPVVQSISLSGSRFLKAIFVISSSTVYRPALAEASVPVAVAEKVLIIYILSQGKVHIRNLNSLGAVVGAAGRSRQVFLSRPRAARAAAGNRDAETNSASAMAEKRCFCFALHMEIPA